MVVFDSANLPSKDLKAGDVSFDIYSKQIAQAENLAKNKPFNIFANHHPISIVLPTKKSSNEEFNLKLNSLGILMKQIQGDSLLSTNFQASLHGHVHTAQALSYENKQPVTFVSGNGGSALEESYLNEIHLSSKQLKNLKIKQFERYLDFGFATLDRQDKAGMQWAFTEYSRDGQKMFSCLLSKNQLQCNR